MKISDVIQILETWAPPEYQESYDNAQLLCGDNTKPVTSVLLTLDCTEKVVIEAIEKGCNLIVAHHPIIFSGLKRITGANYIERTIIKAIKNDVAIYALHTNLDSISSGVNYEIARRLGLQDIRVLSPKPKLFLKLCTYVPVAHLEAVKTALFNAGAGHIGAYDHCSFSHAGTGTFRGSMDSNPMVGQPGIDHSEAEIKLEMILPNQLKNKVVKALKDTHPYEEVAFDLIELENDHTDVGSGMIGELSTSMKAKEFLHLVSSQLNTTVIRHTKLLDGPIKRVAFCGGAGGFLLRKAISVGADIFLTSDFKYHEFFNAEEKITILDVGHFESEQFTPHLIASYLEDKNVTFAVLLSEVNTNPVHYFIS